MRTRTRRLAALHAPYQRHDVLQRRMGAVRWKATHGADLLCPRLGLRVNPYTVPETNPHKI